MIKYTKSQFNVKYILIYANFYLSHSILSYLGYFYHEFCMIKSLFRFYSINLNFDRVY